MRIRTSAALAASTLTLMPALLALTVAASASGCDSALEPLHVELEASDGMLNADVARALKNAVEACPDQTSNGDDPLAEPTASSASRPDIKAHVVFEPAVLPEACGFAGPVTGHDPDAPLTAYLMAVAYTESKNEYGPADVAYDPSTHVASYKVRGPTYGMTGTGPAGAPGVSAGSIFVHGVSIPATYVTVNTGCDVDNPTLCWGIGHAELMIRNVGIAVLSAFNHC